PDVAVGRTSPPRTATFHRFSLALALVAGLIERRLPQARKNDQARRTRLGDVPCQLRGGKEGRQRSPERSEALKQTVRRQDKEIQILKRFVGRGTKQGRAHLKQVRGAVARTTNPSSWRPATDGHPSLQMRTRTMT
ncbi:unnamed protein product, partial [Ectocarpus sp. 12 AP-2014]